MKRGSPLAFVAALWLLVVVVGAASLPAGAQAPADDGGTGLVEQTPLDPAPTPAEGTELVRSNTQVRTAVLGLLGVALVTWVVTVVYWHQTGREARRRFLEERQAAVGRPPEAGRRRRQPGGGPAAGRRRGSPGDRAEPDRAPVDRAAAERVDPAVRRPSPASVFDT